MQTTVKHLIELLSDASRMLADVHYAQSKSRRSLILTTLSKSAKDVLEKFPIAEAQLFGLNLGEQLKLAEVVEKSGLELRLPPKTVPAARTPTVKKSLNSRGPSRSFRGSRQGGPKRSYRVQQPPARPPPKYN